MCNGNTERGTISRCITFTISHRPELLERYEQDDNKIHKTLFTAHQQFCQCSPEKIIIGVNIGRCGSS